PAGERISSGESAGRSVGRTIFPYARSGWPRVVVCASIATSEGLARSVEPEKRGGQGLQDGSSIGFFPNCSQEDTPMETPKALETARGETTLIGTSIVIKGELSCGEDLYIDGQVEGTIDPKGNRLTIGPHGRVKANVNASAVVVQGKRQ